MRSRWWYTLAYGVLPLVLACGGADKGTPQGPGPSTPVEPGAETQGVPTSRGGTDRVGQPAPAWGEMAWINTAPLSLEDLRGRVVLIRFWTDTCPFCRASAPALAQIHADYAERGVTVVGLYHPKPKGSDRTPAQVSEVTQGWGWEFPVGLDLDWRAMDAFWLSQRNRDYTSVSFVLDRQGVIRYVHPGPEFHPGGPSDHENCRRDYAEIRRTLDVLLDEPLPS